MAYERDPTMNDLANLDEPKALRALWADTHAAGYNGVRAAHMLPTLPAQTPPKK